MSLAINALENHCASTLFTIYEIIFPWSFEVLNYLRVWVYFLLSTSVLRYILTNNKHFLWVKLT
jgi:hypothetical protein